MDVVVGFCFEDGGASSMGGGGPELVLAAGGSAAGLSAAVADGALRAASRELESEVGAVGGLAAPSLAAEFSSGVTGALAFLTPRPTETPSRKITTATTAADMNRKTICLPRPLPACVDSGRS